MDTIYLGNDHVITLANLTDSAGDPILSASVSATLLHGTTNQEIAGQTWPINMVHDAGGTYSCTIDKDVEISRGGEYVLRVVAAAGESDARWDIEVVAAWRQ